LTEVALLSAVSTCVAFGIATVGQFRYLVAAEGGPLAVLPGLRALRPRRAAIGDASGRLELRAMFARAIVAAGPVTSGVYCVDAGSCPGPELSRAGKGWNDRRGRGREALAPA
jgi:hypothetical protein